MQSAMNNAPKSRSLFGRIADRLVHQPAPPPPPRPPGVDQSAWARNVEQAQVIHGLTVRQVGLSVFGETQSLSDQPGSNESIDAAREKLAHVVINGARLRGAKRPSVHPPIEPSAEVLRNPAVLAAYESSMRAAREAYLNGTDPTQGAIYLLLPVTPDRSDRQFPNASVPLRTQSGPDKNSFPNKDVPSNRAWVNTYAPEQER
jgi:hypothetical protein